MRDSAQRWRAVLCLVRKQASPAVSAGPAERGVGSMLPPQPRGDAQAAAVGNRFSDWAIVMGAIAFLVFPIILGPGTIILASVALTKKEQRAPIALTVRILGLTVGMILGAIVYANPI